MNLSIFKLEEDILHTLKKYIERKADQSSVKVRLWNFHIRHLHPPSREVLLTSCWNYQHRASRYWLFGVSLSC